MIMRKLIYITNVLLAAIAILLTTIAFLLYQQRPITMSQLIQAGESTEDEKRFYLLQNIPLTRIINEPLAVEIQNSPLEVEVANTPIGVAIER